MHKEQFENTVAAMKKFALENHVPIMEDEGISQLTSLLKEQKPDAILEIGAAIGFSALKMADALPGTLIDTIERDEERYLKATEFINDSGYQEQIRIFKADALEMDLALLNNAYDAIFIDAAKGQYERFFEKYEVLLNSGGVIYCDNMHMHGMSAVPLEEIPRRKRTMIRNLRKFKESMMEHARYETRLLDIGDGIMVCRKR
ncbi:O-methyltransferase [Planococcus halotolerans]|uniref:SAM-dependent methyltransferase n=1 Tax=Planococcus halotolerans TaxID=2233542 RepID=A0A365KTU1_9BACL|nr:O-methyltransferase [Planococcus halotolerans]QHJ71539.1 SAM-dependent methyltransferase [Planococcus halotolerans]RAZ76606.1 SAM-dependent methyltransferase [Planococcus halotolerans]